MENCKLPKELFIEILARLPVRLLMRFKCVCKIFYDLIKNNHHFAHKHYEISQGKNDCVLIEFSPVPFPYPNKVFSFLYKESECDEIGSTYLDFPNSITRYVICCHGLLCLVVGKGDFVIDQSEVVDMIFDVVIWNPSTREIKALPSITVPNKPSNIPPINFCMFEGFGFGLSNNMTWKFVMLWYYADSDILSKVSYEIVTVCSCIGGSWCWRQINAVPQLPVRTYEDFYLKGKYYWRVEVPAWLESESGRRLECLLWFDLDDEVFGTIELPSKLEPLLCSLVTVMNDTIAIVTYPDPLTENCIEIWLMKETNNSIDWNKQVTIECGDSIDLHEYWNPIGDWESEFWRPIGIWNLGGILLVFPSISRYIPDFEHEDDELPGQDSYIPYLIAIDLATQRRNIIYLTQQRKSVNIVSNSIGYAQIYHEENINIIEEWKNNVKIFLETQAYARVYSESIKFP